MESKEIKRFGITRAELTAGVIAVISCCLMFWKQTDVRISALELRMNFKEQTDGVINIKLDKLQEGVNDVKIHLQNKADRK
jgi:hypothetical protein